MVGIEPAAFFAFWAGAIILNLTPGPDMALTLASTARGGVRAGLMAALGIVVGSFVWAALTAGGVAALLAASATAMFVIRTLGAVYLLYLAVMTWRKRREPISIDGNVDAAGAFRAGLLTNLFNPKVGLFFLAFLPAFVSADNGPLWTQIFALGALFSLSGGVVLALAAYAAASVRSKFAAASVIQERMNIAAAGVFGAMGCAILFTRNH